MFSFSLLLCLFFAFQQVKYFNLATDLSTR